MKSKNKFLTLKVAEYLDLHNLPLSKGDKIIALFIVSQTNYHGNYDVYVRKFKKLLGRNTLQLDKVFDVLVQADIIKLVQAGKYKEQCRTYAMVKPFNVDTDICDVVSFQFEAPGTPTFINRFIADGFTYKEFSKFQPRKKIPQSQNESKLITRIQQLEALLKFNNIAIPASMDEVNFKKQSESIETPIQPTLSVVLPDEIIESVASQDGIEIRLTDRLSIIPYDHQLVILSDEAGCYIDNYSEIEEWVKKMDMAEQVRLFSTLLNQPGVGIIVPIKGKVKAHFQKMVDGSHQKVVFKSIIAA
ncbi:hypothetical protein LJ707_13215 [Mucilaginibacter sp. UR6-1]|uniref:hypothetical protein n=1 Tax=Mucilaginibacter sp. UR6-1 TaxID=1435643 RepID=UPI001E447011|nr:hypothetical protein [Mucilaginibacter sp. UR6-1]MCC8409891.1 hypothetical protein [Mucilaginibacter sp. UR6-1]